MSPAQTSAWLSLYVSFNNAVPPQNVDSYLFSNEVIVILIQSWSRFMVIIYIIISPSEDVFSHVDLLILAY